jgi:hypothetical protein
MLVVTIIGRKSNGAAGLMKLIREIMRGERDESSLLVAFLLLAEGIVIAILLALKLIFNHF